jgi:hypothetical protein
VQVAPAFRPMALISVEASYEHNDVTLPGRVHDARRERP